MPFTQQEIPRQHAEQDRRDGREDGSHSIGIDGHIVRSEAIEHDLVEVVREVAADDERAGAAAGHGVEVEDRDTTD